MASHTLGMSELRWDPAGPGRARPHQESPERQDLGSRGWETALLRTTVTWRRPQEPVTCAAHAGRLRLVRGHIGKRSHVPHLKHMAVIRTQGPHMHSNTHGDGVGDGG